MTDKAKKTEQDETIEVYNVETGKTTKTTLKEHLAAQEQPSETEPEETSAPDYSQDESEVSEMLDFYKQAFNEVYKLICLNCERVIAVEVTPVRTDGVVLMEKQRTLYTHNDLCLSVRRREDRTSDNKPMYGYECSCGNRTILAKVERGEVAERTIIKNKKDEVVGDSGPIAPSSPFERARQQKTILDKQAKSKEKADYETDGNTERYETFKLERVK